MGLVAQVWVGGAFAGCWVEIGQRYAIEPELLYAIAKVESDLDPSAVNHNTDGSRDLGLMQINTWHLPRLQGRGITEERLLQDSCLSVDVGASILSEFITRYGYNWTAVGAYNAGNAPDRQKLRLRYAHKVWQHYQALFVERGQSSKL